MEHFGKLGLVVRSIGSNTRLTGTEPINPRDDGLNSVKPAGLGKSE